MTNLLRLRWGEYSVLYTKNGFFATEDAKGHGKEISCPSVFSVADKNVQFVPVFGILQCCER